MPIPKHERDKNWSNCGRCAAEFFAGAAEDTTKTIAERGLAARPFCAELPVAADETARAVPQVGAASSHGGDRDLVEQLERLARLHSSGALDVDEFQRAKQQILNR